MDAASMTATAPIESDDLGPLLEAIYRTYHYDFRAYARSSLYRNLARAEAALGMPAPQLVNRALSEPAVFSQLLRYLTVQVSDLFRDADYFRVLRDRVVPHLATYASPRVWVAGCGTGEEAYSIAIVLHEAGLLERSLIYATDIDAQSLVTAEAGVYATDRVRTFSENYFKAGGRASLSEYYTAARSGSAFSRALKKRISFTDHSLATDAAFAEVQLVSCRNVFIYFDQTLQDRCTGLFRESLCPRGFLGLGSMETLAFSSHASAFEPFAAPERVYRLK
jgi:chemotaxis protein methyltransferase CheR